MNRKSRADDDDFRLLVEGVRGYAIFRLTPEGNVATWNAGAERIKGWTAGEILGRHFSIFFRPQDVAAGQPERELRETDTKGQFEEAAWRVRKDGSHFWADVLITALRGPDGSLKGYAKVTRDLTNRKQAEETLRSVVHHVIDGIISIDERGTIASFNPAAEKIFGYASQEVVGRNVNVLMPEPYYSEHDGYLRNYLRTGEAKIIGTGREVVGRRKDGSTFPMDLAVSAFTVGASRFFTGIVRDITDRKRLEDALRQRVADLDQADRHKNEFLAMLGHELRNPLAPIRNAVHVMKMAHAPPEDVERARVTMERQLQHLIRLVDDLLDVSRIIQGTIDLRREETDLATILERAVETARPVIDAQGHELIVSLPPRPIRLDADIVRVAQAVANLLVNAAKYTERAGRIWLAADREEGEVVIRVRDTGSGIDPQLLPRVFELFVQADRTLARSRGGLGIGLTLVKKLVEMHGGRVGAASAGLGQGSEFTIRLPASPDAAGKETTMITEDKAAGAARRILVVDDNIDAAESTAMILKLGGHEVHTVHDGLSVLPAVRDFRPEIVLLDIGLPGMDGYEVAEKLRAQPEYSTLTLAAMTGYGQDEDRRRSRQAGFDFHLTKPVDPIKLEEFVASLGPARP